MLERLALPTDAWAALRQHALDRGIVFLSTPFDDASADLLDAMDVPGFKIGSGELTNLPFLERLARRGRPMIVSTGMATMVEVAAAVDTIRADRACRTRAAPLRVRLSGRAWGREPGGDADDARRLRAADRLVGPHARHRAADRRDRAGCHDHREAPDAGPDAPRAGSRDVARAVRVRGDGRGDPSHGGRRSATATRSRPQPSARSPPSRGGACTGLAISPRARPSRRAICSPSDRVPASPRRGCTSSSAARPLAPSAPARWSREGDA